MATSSELISALGAGSGVDVRALAESLVNVERAPREDAINNKISTQERRIAGYSALMLALDTVKEAFAKLNDKSEFNANQTSNSHPSAFDVSTTGAAQTGSHAIRVVQLAQGQRSVTAGFATASTSLNGGAAMSLRLTVGGQALNPIAVAAGSDTPAGVVAAINAANQGITARLVDTGDANTPQRVVLEGPIGGANTFSLASDDASGGAEVQTLTFGAASAAGTLTVAGVSVTLLGTETAAEVATKVKTALDASDYTTGRSVADPGDGTLQITLAVSDNDAPDVAVDAGDTGVTSSVAETTAFVAGSSLAALAITSLQPAQNAQVEVNGLTIERATNQIEGALTGVTLQLRQPMAVGESATLGVTRNVAEIKQNLLDLVDAYNSAVADIGILGGERSDDEEDIYSGSLAGDSYLRRIKNDLRQMMLGTSSTASGTMQAMRNLGLDVDRTGVMSIDNDKLDAALAENFDDVTAMLSANTDNQSEYGSAARGLAGDAVKLINDLISSRGTIMQQSENAQARIADYQVELETLERRMEALLTRYTQQFGIMETFVGQANSLRESLASTFEGMMAVYTKK